MSPRPKLAPTQKAAAQPVVLSSDEINFVRSMVIYEDSHILALNKPAGLSSQGGRGQVHTLDELLWAFAKPGKARPRLIHRLDRDTSGVILTARTKPDAAFLGNAMMARRFHKAYRAIVAPGGPSAGVITTPLRRDEQGREAFMRVCDPEHPDAETAKTVYRTLVEGPDAALLELEPHTGRMHQLRVHMASVGRPLAGDPRYGGAMVLGGVAAPRLMLHAGMLSFPHPDGGIKRIEAEPPADFLEVAAKLGLGVAAAFVA